MEEINEKFHSDILNFNEEKRSLWMRERKPYSVLFELTSNCNMNCIHCYLQNSHIAHQMSFERIIEIIDLLYDIGILFITFTGGEILTRKDFVDIYLYAKKKGFLVELFSNGYLFNDSLIGVLKEYPPLLVDISIYGACEETYKTVTGIDGAFEKVVSNCIKLKDAGIRVALKTPVLKQTLREVESMKTLATKLGIPFVYTFDLISTIDRDDGPKKLSVPLEIALKHEFMDYYKQMELSGRKNLDNDEERQNQIGILEKNDCVYACNVALNSFVIDYKGKICPCMKLRHYGVELTRETYSDIWENFRKFSQRKASKTYKCKGCEARYYCDVCPAEMDFLYGNEEIRPGQICKVAQIRKDFYSGKMTLEEALQRASYDE